MTRQLRTFTTRHLLTLAVAGLALLATPATARAAFLDFTVDEGSVPGAVGHVFIADKIDGTYVERFSTDGAGNFEATIIADFTVYKSSDGTVNEPSQLGVPPDTIFTPDSFYGLYALATATGTITGGPTEFEFHTSSIDVSVWIDPLLDTDKDLPASGGDPAVLAGDGDDYLIMTASHVYFEDNVLRVGVGGFFDIRFDDAALTTPPGCTAPECGTSYWPDLPITGLKATVDGDFDTFDPTIAADTTLTGQLSVVFVPEPASLALLGIGFAAVGIAARRRQRTR